MRISPALLQVAGLIATAPGPISADALTTTLLAGPISTIWNASNSFLAASRPTCVATGSPASSRRTFLVADRQRSEIIELSFQHGTRPREILPAIIHA